ncbi:hypothetical protein ABS71_05765 [bacterium SCN 62-11]|mgnify:CR=1 FL=1|nr:MAG: hypothetical protein ABS71_05765 [bacterium SCN 62-11]
MHIGNNQGMRPTWNHQTSNRGPAQEPPQSGGEDGLDLSGIAQQTMSHLSERKPLLQMLQIAQPVQHHFDQTV